MTTPDWNARYSEPGYAYGTQPNLFLVESVHRIPRGPVLSLGEGEGRNAVFLASQGYAVHAVDGSPVGLAKARALASDRGVQIETEVADLAAYAIPPGTFAGIVSIFLHLPREQRAHLHAQVYQGLAPGGVFLLEAYGPEQLTFGTGGPRTPDRLAGLEELQAELPGLDWIIARETDRDVVEGRYHLGPAAVVQLLGVKP